MGFFGWVFLVGFLLPTLPAAPSASSCRRCGIEPEMEKKLKNHVKMIFSHLRRSRRLANQFVILNRNSSHERKALSKVSVDKLA